MEAVNVEVMTRRERKKQQTREQMLRSAKHLFREKGYEHTSIEDITERADVSKSTLFKHFPNKESLLIGLADEEVNDVLSLMETKEYIVLDVLSKIQRILMRLIEDSIPYLRLTGQILFTTMINKNNIGSPFKTLRDEIEKLVKKGQEQGIIKEDLESGIIAMTILGSYYGVLFKWFEDGGEAGGTEEMMKAIKIVIESIRK